MRKITLSLFLSMIFTFSLVAQELELRENKEFKGLGDYVRQAGFSPFRNYFAYTIGDNTLRIFDKNWEKLFEHQGDPKSVGGVFAFSPDEKYLAYGRFKGVNDIAIIRLSDQKVVQVLERHTEYISHLEFSHDGNYLSSVSTDESLIIWKRTGDEFSFLQIVNEGFEYYLNESSFSHDDRFLVTGDDRGNVKVFEQKNGVFKVFQEFKDRSNSIESVVFHPKRQEFVTGSRYGVRRYVLKKDAFVFSDSLAEHAGVTHPMFYSPGGKYLSLTNYSDIRIFRDEGKGFVEVDAIFRHFDNMFGASFSEDGKFLVSFGSDQRIIIWEIENVDPSDKTMVSGWLIGDLSIAQRRALTPGITSKIINATDPEMAAPRDEFEKTIEYNARMEKLSDHTLSIFQAEIEKLYGIKSQGSIVKIPLSALIGYNADVEVYKIRFMETEAGVNIPVDQARMLKKRWKDAYLQASKVKIDGKLSFLYENFELILPGSSVSFEATPIENPFQQLVHGQRTSKIRNAGLNEEIIRDSVNGNTYALLFATNVYDYFKDLINPVLDAQTISLELQENYGVITEVVLNASLGETAAKLREFASRSYDEKDNLMVFFAGHGIYDEVFREGYVISRDSRMDDLGKTSYLSHSNLRTMINNINCPHIFLVMDVCFGGTFDPHLASAHRGSGLYADISTEQFVQRKLKYTTRLYLTSGGKEYVPDGRPGFHSPFARRFIESLRFYGGEDGVLTTAEILQFVEKTTPQPRFGEFGDNEPGSDFILVIKKEDDV